MSDSSQKEMRQTQFKLSELILSAKNLSEQIERIKEKHFLSARVIDLNEYRARRNKKRIKTVLVIDDEEGLKESLGKTMEKKGYQAFFAQDLQSLSEIMSRVSFDLILLELDLEWMDSLEFCRLMKGNKFLRELPIILVSKEKDAKRVRKAFEYGCDEYLTKPLNLERVARTISYFLENY